MASKKKQSDYRSFVGSLSMYDLDSAMQFNLLTTLGLRETHYVLDIGCGSLRSGRLFIPYLLQGRYFGIEPNQWLIDEGIKNDIGQDLINIKKPTFSNDKGFSLSIFDQKFDFIIAQSIFSHASQSQISKCLSEAKKVMKPSAIFVATFVVGNNNYTDDKWIYPEYVSYTLEYMVSLAHKHGLRCKLLDWPHLDRQKWITFVNPEIWDNTSTLYPYPHPEVLYNDKIEQNTATIVRRGPARQINQVGQLIWKLCDGIHTRQDILKELQSNFEDVDENVLANDLDKFLIGLVSDGFLRLYNKGSNNN